MVLTSPITLNPFIHIEWLININTSSTIIFDIENLDGKASADLILPQSNI